MYYIYVVSNLITVPIRIRLKSIFTRYSKTLKNYFNKVLSPYLTVSKPKTSSVCIGTFSCFKWRKANDKIAYGVCWNSIKAFWCQDVHLQHTRLFQVKKRTCHATPKHVWELILFEKKINLSGKKNYTSVFYGFQRETNNLNRFKCCFCFKNSKKKKMPIVF